MRKEAILKKIDRLPKPIRSLLRRIGKLADKRRCNVYLVGGFVRDLLLGVENLDVDIVIEKDGIEFAEELGGILPACLVRHHRFGTASLRCAFGIKLDIATSRSESYEQPASLPDVKGAAIRDDLWRRDFTINAMAIKINQSDFGRLVDFFGGESDLKKGKIRVLHNLSFIDDPTRILRGVRFTERYNFKMERKTLKLMKEAAARHMLERVQKQRLRDELILLLKEPRPKKCLLHLVRISRPSFIHPKIKLDSSFSRDLKKIEEEIDWFRLNFPKKRTLDEWLIYLMGLLDNLNLKQTQSFCDEFALRRGDRARLISYKKKGRRLLWALSEKRPIKASFVYRKLQPLSYEVLLMLKAKANRNITKQRINDFLNFYNGIRISVTGRDLALLGLEPGPRFKQVFKALLYRKINGKIKGRKDELNYLKKILAR